MKKIAALFVGLLAICATTILSGQFVPSQADSSIHYCLAVPFVNDHQVIEIAPVKEVKQVYEISRNERMTGYKRKVELRANSPPSNYQCRIRSDTYNNAG